MLTPTNKKYRPRMISGTTTEQMVWGLLESYERWEKVLWIHNDQMTKLYKKAASCFF